MLDNKNKKELFENNYLLNDINNKNKIIKFAKDKLVIYILAVIFSIVIIGALYFISPYSKTFKVVVNGNYYLKDEEIIDKANLSDYFLLSFPNRTKNILKKDPLIEDADVHLLNGNIVSIEVKEVKQIGYIYEDNESKLLLVNDERISLTRDNMYLIEKVPLIVGYSKEELIEIEKGFLDVEPETINEISEIHKFPTSYDNIQMEIIMRDGNYCFLSSYGINLLENYYMVASSIDSSKGNVCAYFDEITNSAYISSCPWQIDTSPEEIIENEE